MSSVSDNINGQTITNSNALKTPTQYTPQEQETIRRIESTPNKGRDMAVIGRENFTPNMVDYVLKNNRPVAVDKLAPAKAKELGFAYPDDVRRTIHKGDIEHTLIEHGKNSNKVKKSGQKPVTKANIANWTKYADRADITVQSVDNKGNPIVISGKQINGYYAVVEQIRKGRNELSFKTMYFENGKLENHKEFKGQFGRKTDSTTSNVGSPINGSGVSANGRSSYELEPKLDLPNPNRLKTVATDNQTIPQSTEKSNGNATATQQNGGLETHPTPIQHGKQSARLKQNLRQFTTPDNRLAEERQKVLRSPKTMKHAQEMGKQDTIRTGAKSKQKALEIAFIFGWDKTHTPRFDTISDKWVLVKNTYWDSEKSKDEKEDAIVADAVKSVQAATAKINQQVNQVQAGTPTANRSLYYQTTNQAVQPELDLTTSPTQTAKKAVVKKNLTTENTAKKADNPTQTAKNTQNETKNAVVKGSKAKIADKFNPFQASEELLEEVHKALKPDDEMKRRFIAMEMKNRAEIVNEEFATRQDAKERLEFNSWENEFKIVKKGDTYKVVDLVKPYGNLQYGKRQGLEKLPDIPVVHLNGNEFDAEKLKDMQKLADDFLRVLQASKEPLHNNEQNWDLQISSKDRKKMGDNAKLPKHTTQAVAGIRDLAKNAVLVETHEDAKHSNPDVIAIHRLYAPVQIGDTLYRAKLTVKDYSQKDGNQFKNLHAIETVEIETAGLGTLPTAKQSVQKSAQPTTLRDTVSISQLLQNAKSDIDGKPLIDEKNQSSVSNKSVSQSKNTKDDKQAEVSGSLKDKIVVISDKIADLWVKSLGLKSLNDEYIPKIPQEVADKLNKPIKVKKGSLLKIIQNKRTQYIEEIKPTFETPDMVLKDADGLLFAKKIGDELYFVNVNIDKVRYFVGISQAPKTAKNIENKLKDGAEVLYRRSTSSKSNSPSHNVQTFTDFPSSANSNGDTSTVSVSEKGSDDNLKQFIGKKWNDKTIQDAVILPDGAIQLQIGGEWYHENALSYSNFEQINKIALQLNHSDLDILKLKAFRRSYQRNIGDKNSEIYQNASKYNDNHDRKSHKHNRGALENFAQVVARVDTALKEIANSGSLKGNAQPTAENLIKNAQEVNKNRNNEKDIYKEILEQLQKRKYTIKPLSEFDTNDSIIDFSGAEEHPSITENRVYIRDSVEDFNREIENRRKNKDKPLSQDIIDEHNRKIQFLTKQIEDLRHSEKYQDWLRHQNAIIEMRKPENLKRLEAEIEDLNNRIKKIVEDLGEKNAISDDTYRKLGEKVMQRLHIKKSIIGKKERYITTQTYEKAMKRQSKEIASFVSYTGNLKAKQSTVNGGLETHPTAFNLKQQKSFNPATVKPATDTQIKQAVVTPKRQAVNSEQAKEQANAFLRKELINKHSGLPATVHNSNLRKMISNSAAVKSVNSELHALAVANVDELYQNAIYGWRKTDRDNSPDIAGIHRLFATLRTEQGDFVVKMTVKEYTQPEQNNALYTVEALEVETQENSPAYNSVKQLLEHDKIGGNYSTNTTGGIESLIKNAQSVNKNKHYSLSEKTDSDFARAVDDIANGGVAGRQHITLGTMPDVFKLIGLPDSRVNIRRDTIQKAMGEFLGLQEHNHSHIHNLTPETLKQIPEQLNNPIAIMQSSRTSTNPNAFVVLTELTETDSKTGKQKPIVAILAMHKTNDGVEVTTIRSIYGRSREQIEKGLMNNLRFWHKTKGLQFVKNFRLRLPSDAFSTANLVKHNIKTNDDLSQAEKQQQYAQTLYSKANAIRENKASVEHKNAVIDAVKAVVGEENIQHIDITTASELQRNNRAFQSWRADEVAQIEGFQNEDTGRITLVSNAFDNMQTAGFVAWHELAHRGIGVKGRQEYRKAMVALANKHKFYRRVAAKYYGRYRKNENLQDFTSYDALEESLVDFYAAYKTGDWATFEQRNGVKVSENLKKYSERNSIQRLWNEFKAIVSQIFGIQSQALSDKQLFALLRGLDGVAGYEFDPKTHDLKAVKPENRYSLSAMKSVLANIVRGKKAMNKALLEKTDIHRAMYRNDIGWVDFVYGDKNKGLLHIFKRRLESDNMTKEEVVKMLTNQIVETIAQGETVAQTNVGNSAVLKIDYNGYRASLVKNKGSNAWLLTAFELYKGANSKGYDKTIPTDTSPTLSRTGTGALYSATGSERAETTANLPKTGTAFDKTQSANSNRTDDTQTHLRKGRGLGADSINSVSQNAGDNKRYSLASNNKALAKINQNVVNDLWQHDEFDWLQEDFADNAPTGKMLPKHKKLFDTAKKSKSINDFARVMSDIQAALQNGEIKNSKDILRTYQSLFERTVKFKDLKQYGKEELQAIADNPNFQAWFAKAHKFFKNTDGTPKVFYRGLKIDKGDIGSLKNNASENEYGAEFFTDNAIIASTYSTMIYPHNGFIQQVAINAEKPFIVPHTSGNDWNNLLKDYTVSQVVRLFKMAGFDTKPANWDSSKEIEVDIAWRSNTKNVQAFYVTGQEEVFKFILPTVKNEKTEKSFIDSVQQELAGSGKHIVFSTNFFVRNLQQRGKFDSVVFKNIYDNGGGNYHAHKEDYNGVGTVLAVWGTKDNQAYAKELGNKGSFSKEDKRIFYSLKNNQGATAGNLNNQAIKPNLLATMKAKIANMITEFAKNKAYAFVDLMPMSDEEVAQAKLHGLDIAGYKHLIDTDAIRHIHQRHGNEKTESKKGLVAVKGADYLAIVEVTSNPDKRIYGGKTLDGKDSIVSVKRMADNSTVVVEEVRTGRKKLAVKTMYKHTATVDMRSIVKNIEHSQPYAQSDSGRVVTDIKAQTVPNGKTRFSLNTTQSEFDATAKQYGGEKAYKQAKADGKTALTYKQWVQVRTPSFKAWFGDWENDPENASKVIHPDTGEPLVVYHGTKESFTAFNREKIEVGNGFWFSSDYSEAESYSFDTDEIEDGKEPIVMPVFLNVKKPATLEVVNGSLLEKYRKKVKAKVSPEVFIRDKQAVEYLRSSGYDGLMFDDKTITYNPNQIKSATDNIGTFDAKNPDIRYSLKNANQPTIKEQIRQNADKLNNMPTVASVTGTAKNITALRQEVLQHLKDTGGFVVDVPNFGKVELGEKEITQSLRYIETDAEKLAFKAIKPVLKRGLQITNRDNHKGRGYATVTFAAPVELNGKRALMAVVVKQTGKNHYKMHRVLTPDGEVFNLNNNGKVGLRRESVLSDNAVHHQQGTDRLIAPTHDSTNTVTDNVANSMPNGKTRFSLAENSDKKYLQLVEKYRNGDLSVATELREMVDNAAAEKGYAPKNPDEINGWSAPAWDGLTQQERWQSIENGDALTWNLEDIAHGYANQPLEMYEVGSWFYRVATPEQKQTIAVIDNAITEMKRQIAEHGKVVDMPKVTVYRAVPKDVVSAFRNGDWISLSRDYAVSHGKNALHGEYSIQKMEVPAHQIWTDGNDMSEWGFDDGKDLIYKNVKNNRKSNALFELDNKGKVIPLSQRFNEKKKDIRYSLSPQKSVQANITRGKKAMNKALLEKTDVHRAMYRNDIGWVDFVYGSVGTLQPNGKTKGAMGLVHIIEARMRKDKMTRQEVVKMLTESTVETIAQGTTSRIYESTNGKSQSVFVEWDGVRVTLVRNKGSNAWLMNAFELHSDGVTGKSKDYSATTQSKPTLHRQGVGASDTQNVANSMPTVKQLSDSLKAVKEVVGKDTYDLIHTMIRAENAYGQDETNPKILYSIAKTAEKARLSFGKQLGDMAKETYGKVRTPLMKVKKSKLFPSGWRVALGNKWKDSLNVQLQFLGRRHIVDIFDRVFDGRLKAYSNLVSDMDAMKNSLSQKHDDLVRDWGKLPTVENDKLVDLMHRATLAKYDPDTKDGEVNYRANWNNRYRR